MPEYSDKNSEIREDETSQVGVELGLTKQISQVCSDIQIVQHAIKRRVFEAAAKLFLKKWTSKYRKLDEFFKYFEEQWIESIKKSWYEGVGFVYIRFKNLR